MTFQFRFRHPIEEFVKNDDARDARTQCKVYGANRYYFLFLTTFSLFLFGRFMWAFPSFFDMFVKSGAYLWLCTDEEIAKASVEQVVRAACEQQTMGINNIFSYLMASTFFGSIVAGSCNIVIGAKLTAMIGTACMFIGMLLISFSSEAFRLYVPGSIFVGFGIDFLVLPCFNATVLYPGRELLITSLLGASISVGMFVPILMKHVMFKTNISLSVNMLPLPILCVGVFIIACVFFPPKRFYKQSELDEALNAINVETNNGENKKTEKRKKSKKEFILSLFDIELDKVGVLKKSIFSVHFLMLNIIFMIVMITASFYMTISNRMMTEQERNYLAIGMGASVTVCLGLAYFLDKMGSMYIMWFETIFLLMSYITIAFGHKCTTIISIILYSIFTSHLNGQVWLFVVETFDSSISTLLMGLLNLIAGIVMISSPKIYDKLLTNGCKMENIIVFMIGLVGVKTAVLVFLHGWKLKVNKIE
ncbi:uncharacterized protein TA12370 [Theileria annulata]|uniref:Major Facilitator Superfamily n=1 Tax=Theileria annulata TaxID=5874 RepID=Q4UDZ4_THEAN|nr:uncharacterized protein TA12370 [Theileria annulata]CAI74695.1 hypothetical protein, conserved [Theileria annulata]|eukprot:XP_952427.1 hypothetical protein, conserved [Theileria annulata]